MADNGGTLGAEGALERLCAGNESFLQARCNDASIAPDLRKRLASEGQRPYAAVLACADSRVVPEDVFMTGLGELFVVRVAGNVAGNTQVASIVYAVEHLGLRLVVVMGHTGCGAVAAAMAGGDAGGVAPVVDLVVQAIGDEADSTAAACANVRFAVGRLRAVPELAALLVTGELLVVGALYHTDSGLVEWLQDA